MLFDYLVVAISLKLASIDQKAFGVFFNEKKTVWPKYQRHPLKKIFKHLKVWRIVVLPTPYGYHADQSKSSNLLNMKYGNTFRHDSHTCLLQNVVKFSFAGPAKFSRFLSMMEHCPVSILWI